MESPTKFSVKKQSKVLRMIFGRNICSSQAVLSQKNRSPLLAESHVSRFSEIERQMVFTSSVCKQVEVFLKTRLVSYVLNDQKNQEVVRKWINSEPFKMQFEAFLTIMLKYFGTRIDSWGTPLVSERNGTFCR